MAKANNNQAELLADVFARLLSLRQAREQSACDEGEKAPSQEQDPIQAVALQGKNKSRLATDSYSGERDDA